MDTVGGGAATPLPSGRQQNGQLSGQPYMQLALYLAGNALTVVIGLLLWNLNTVRLASRAVPGMCCRRSCIQLLPSRLPHPHSPAASLQHCTGAG